MLRAGSFRKLGGILDLGFRVRVQGLELGFRVLREYTDLLQKQHSWANI